MRHVAVPVLVSLGLAGASLAGCGSEGGVASPSDPATFDRTMFNETALKSYQGDAQPFVMGHAIGVYLLGKTVPPYLVPKKYAYRPGASSPFTEIAYEWEGVLVARSGGSNGNGGAIYDDVSIGEDDDTGTGDPSDDVDGEPDGDGGGGDGGDGPGDPFDDVEPCDEIPLIASDCEEFLGAAALRARTLAAQVDARKFAPNGLSGAELDHFVIEFNEALFDALALSSKGESIRNSEVEYVKQDAIADHLCDY
jgi:hypothetical protein